MVELFTITNIRDLRRQTFLLYTVNQRAGLHIFIRKGTGRVCCSNVITIMAYAHLHYYFYDINSGNVSVYLTVKILIFPTLMVQ